MNAGASSNIVGTDADGTNNTLEGNVISGNINQGIPLQGVGTDSNRVAGNYIGTDPSGTAAVPNGNGISVALGASNNTIGGTVTAARNIISGNNTSGVVVGAGNAVGNVVQGNFIGLNAAGTGALPNADVGLLISDTPANVVGGNVSAAANVISGNTGDGVEVQGSNASGNILQGNLIGENAAGDAVVGNRGAGVRLFLSAHDNTIGGVPGDGNTIVGNGSQGIVIDSNAANNVVQSNTIKSNGGAGVAVISASSGNSIRGNSIVSNGDLGIDLGDDGVIPNDNADGDSGPNDLQNFPILNYAVVSGTGTILSGSLNSTPSTTFDIDIYRNPASTGPDPSGFGEGAIYVGSTTVNTDIFGNANFNLTDITGAHTGDTYAATATGSSPPQDTSEFSQDVVAQPESTVVNNADNGPGSLRNAINFANANPGTTISFSIPTSDPGFDGSEFILSPFSELPHITANNTVIDGYTQPGASPNALSGGNNAVLKIWIDGDGSSFSGLTLEDCSNCVVRGLAIGDFGDGITIDDTAAPAPTTNNFIQGCFIGVAPDGFHVAANENSGITIKQGAQNNVIGGPFADACNIIASNSFDGVFISGAGTTGNAVQGNFIGADSPVVSAPGARVGLRIRSASIAASVPNGGSGVVIVQGAQNNVVGGTTTAARNIITGNTVDGVLISDAGTTGNAVQGNYIGVDADGITPVPFAANGVVVAQGAQNNLIGGTATGAGNVVSGNASDGIILTDTNTIGNAVQGNFIGTDSSGTTPCPNSNTGLAIMQGAQNNVVGGTAAAARNIISGNGADGVLISDAGTTGNAVQSNTIGSDISGALPLPNGAIGPAAFRNGVHIDVGANNNVIGSPGFGNIISANSENGIELTGTSGNFVQGNSVGVDASGSGALGNASAGLLVQGGSNNNVITSNIISANGLSGVAITNVNTNSNRVQGNRIGPAANGAAVPQSARGSAQFSNGQHGVSIASGASQNTIDTNVISGNTLQGVVIDGSTTTGNNVLGNLIGTANSGTAALPNGDCGVFIQNGSHGNTIGGTTAARRNVISGNGVAGGTTTSGVVITDSGSTNNAVEGNTIGANAGGTAALPNLNFGVAILNGAANNVIGGTTAGAANLIAFNAATGVAIGGANGTVGNSVVANSIHSNGKLGIDLQGGTEDVNGVTANDPGDADTGPNNLQNYPVITNVTTAGNTTTIAGTFSSLAATTFALDFYHNSNNDASGFGEGEFYVGRQSVTTDASGNTNFSFAATGVFAGNSFTATATNAATGDTSEFAHNHSAVASALSLTIATNPTTTPPTVSEAAGSNAAVGTVARNTFAGTPLTVSLSSSNTGKLTVPATVTIPAGAASATFPIDAVDNAIADGTQSVTITASAGGLSSDSATVQVTDNDTAGIVVTPTSGLSTSPPTARRRVAARIRSRCA